MPNQKQIAQTSVSIRTMTFGDLPYCMELVRQASWNQTEQDWKRAIDLDPVGCFLAEAAGKPVATTTTLCFDDIAWIAMVLVDESARGLGLGRKMLEHALDFLKKRQVKTIRLDATEMGKPLYGKLGFMEEYQVIRYMRPATNDLLPAPANVMRKQPVNEKIPAFDHRISATNRTNLIRHLDQEKDSLLAARSDTTGNLTAYAGVRPGNRAFQIGPAVALEANDGKAVLDAILLQTSSRAVFIDIPVENRAAMDWAISNDFTEQRRFTRMYLGEKVRDLPQHIWASFGPEKG